MAECVVARCVQERRFLKRELQKWGKNVLYLVGLERVAQEIMGVERWAKLSQPQTELETNEIVDWNPDDRCYFCNNWKTSSLDSTNGGSTLVDGSLNDYLSDPDQGTFSRGVSRSASPASVDSDQPLDLSIGNRTRSQSPNGLLIDGEMIGSSVAALLKVPHIPDKSGKLKRPVRVESSTTAAAVCKRSYTEDELQAALQDIRSGKLGTRRAAVIYGIPRSTLRNKVYKLALVGDKSAVLDSTKSGKVETTTTTSVKSKAQSSVIDRDHNFETKISDRGTSASESLRRLLRNRISENLENHHVQQSLYDTSNSSMFASLESNPALAPILSHVLANVHQLALMSLQGGGTQCGGAGDDVKDVSTNLDLPLLPDLIRKLSEKRFEEECNRHRSSSTTTTTTTVSPSSQTANKTENSGTSIAAAAEAAAAVILKIPSYKPVKTVHNSDASGAIVTSSQLSNNSNSNAATTNNNSSSNSNGTRVGGATLREIIAKNITQRVNKNKQSVSSHLGTTVSASNGNVGAKKARTAESPSPVLAGTSTGGGGGGGGGSSHSLRSTRSSTNRAVAYDAVKDTKRDKPEKRCRPKRGRYRNYDRDNLVEAVRAVQRGEMSVHRAGSFYGVPHSTLEYKVKERHLLRPRKHRSGVSSKSGKSLHTLSGKNASSSSSSCSSSSCSTSSTVSSMKAVNNSSVDGSKSSSKEQSMGAASSTTNHTTGGGAAAGGGDSATAATTSNDDNRWSNSPLFALDFSRLNSSNFFASQMMRKLQEDALTQGTRTGDNLSSRDALLLGVLLRNGLQMTESGATNK